MSYCIAEQGDDRNLYSCTQSVIDRFHGVGSTDLYQFLLVTLCGVFGFVGKCCLGSMGS